MEIAMPRLIPVMPGLIQGAQPITWTYTITWPDGTSEPTVTFDGSESDPGPPSVGVRDFPVGVTTIYWTATNLAGSDDCSQTITVIDNQPPTFTADPFEDCVENLFLAQYNGTVNLLYGPDYPADQDYYLFRAGSDVLNIDLDTYTDNCCDITDGYSMRWRIDFDGVEDGSSISGTGQPSTYGSDIQLWGDGINFQNRLHTITYWITDCNGIESTGVSTTITITPRPDIIKITE
jgi:large repetitive protein